MSGENRSGPRWSWSTRTSPGVLRPSRIPSTHMALHWERRRSSSERWSATEGVVLSGNHQPEHESWKLVPKSIQCQISFIGELSSRIWMPSCRTRIHPKTGIEPMLCWSFIDWWYLHGDLSCAWSKSTEFSFGKLKSSWDQRLVA